MPFQRAEATDGTRLSWLAEVFGLAPFELDIVLIALARSGSALRADLCVLQDDVTRRRPSVDLVLNLLCSSAEERLARRACLSSESPLVRHRLIRLIPDPQQVEAPLLARTSSWTNRSCVCFCERGIDARLQSFCEWVEPGSACTTSLSRRRSRPGLAAWSSTPGRRASRYGFTSRGLTFLVSVAARKLWQPLWGPLC